MTVLTYPRHLTKRQEVLKERRAFQFPNAWEFSHDKSNYYLKFNKKLARKRYFKKIKPKKPAFVQFGEEILKTM